MGIGGLLLNLKTITEIVHVKEYAGKRVAVDTYVWLHKGSYSCSSELCQGLPTDKYVEYCMHRVNMLKHFGVTPVLVFDGAALPAKKATEATRYKSRVEHQKLGEQMLRENKSKEAREHFQKAVEISPDVAYRLIDRLRKENVEFIVAPYEADAQLAFLSVNNLVDVVITEDSDLLVYGCKKVLFKMDKFGKGHEISLERLGDNKTPIDFTGFSQKMFRQMCILSGCDYLASVPGLGIKRAHQLIKMYGNASKVIYYLKNKGMNVPDNYELLFEQAELTFLHQRVWDPVQLQLVHLYPLSEALSALPDEQIKFLGPKLTRDIAQQVATAIIHPDTKLPYPKPVLVSSLRRSAPDMSFRTPQNPTIDNYFSATKARSTLGRSSALPKVSLNAGISPYFSLKPTTPITKSKFLINRSTSSPVLPAPRTRPIPLPIPFKKESEESVDAKRLEVVEEKENHVLVVTSRFFPPTPNIHSKSSPKPKIATAHTKFQLLGRTSQTPTKLKNKNV